MGIRLEDARTGRQLGRRSRRRGSTGNVSEAQARALVEAVHVRGRHLQIPADMGATTARALERKRLLICAGTWDGLYRLTEAGRIVGRLLEELGEVSP